MRHFSPLLSGYQATCCYISYVIECYCSEIEIICFYKVLEVHQCEKPAFLNYCDMVARHPNDLITIRYRQEPKIYLCIKFGCSDPDCVEEVCRQESVHTLPPPRLGRFSRLRLVCVSLSLTCRIQPQLRFPLITRSLTYSMW